MIILGAATVPANSTSAVFSLPPGTANCLMWQPTPQTTQVYVGNGKNLTSSNGLPVPLTPMFQESYVTSAGMTCYATTGNATAASFMFILNTGQ